MKAPQIYPEKVFYIFFNLLDFKTSLTTKQQIDLR